MKISTNRPTVSCYSTAVLFLNLRVAELTNDVICCSQLLLPWLSSFASWSWWQSLSRCWCWPLHIPRPGSLRTADRSPCCIPPPAKSFIKVLFWLSWWSTSIIMIDTMNIWRCSKQKRCWRGKWSWIVDLWHRREVNFWSQSQLLGMKYWLLGQD